MAPFQVVSDFVPSGDQPQAISELEQRVHSGEQDIVLLGATGTGKSATTAWLVERLQRPTLVMAPNKTLAAQLATEFRELLPHNAVEYFVSYYDYYQPEAYIPQSDTYIEKDSSINDEVERLRHSATNSLLTRRDVIVVASVSCIYGLGTPQEYVDRMVSLKVGDNEIVTIIGANGAGKTTLMNAIMGVLPLKGRVSFAGEDMARLEIEDRVAAGLSLVPEHRELFSTMNVQDNLELGAFRVAKAKTAASF